MPACPGGGCRCPLTWSLKPSRGSAACNALTTKNDANVERINGGKEGAGFSRAHVAQKAAKLEVQGASPERFPRVPPPSACVVGVHPRSA